MRRRFWLVLFLSVLTFLAWTEGAFILIYYTIWTFLLETLYFALLLAGVESKHLFDMIFAPSIVVFVGFWLVIAPTYIASPKPNNAMFVLVTHGCNALALVSEIRSLSTATLWKPIVYTIVYNLFLVVYVGAGGRSVSGRLPYWYAEYDKPIGWVFFAISVLAVAAVHVIAATYVWPATKQSVLLKQYIV